VALIYNLTPHPVQILDENNQVLATYPASGMVMRLKEDVTPVGSVDNIPLVEKSFSGEVAGGDMPPAGEDVYYIVSLVVAQAVKRSDFIVPDDLVRDESGRVIGARRFAIVK
jgi:hypothetical protein